MKLWLVIFSAVLLALAVNDSLNYLARYGWPG